MGTKPESHTQPGAGEEQDPALLAGTTRLILRLCLPSEMVTRLFGVGEVVLRASPVERHACARWWNDGRSCGESVALECSGQAGVLLLESRLALVAVNSVLGLGMPPFGGPLSRIERGILEGTVAALLAKLGPANAVRVRPRVGAGTAVDPPVGSFGVELLVRLQGESGRACLLASDRFLEELWVMTEASKAEVLPWLELASTKVPSAQISRAEAGDTVVFDETPALSPSGAWPVRARWRSKVVPARWLPDGLVVVVGGSSGAPMPEAATRPDRRMDADSRTAMAPIGDASVEMSAGVLCPAVDVIRRAPLVVRRGGSLVLRTGNHPWAYGELAECAGVFAVSIRRKLAG